ncbi:hypothetical protein O7623_00060 [Solwaraspora sp. WMMD791]|uniref:hypothetical protein n=1 Tax=Solwaraspora sp. WMMD791 TaxID=3016086 RepID=UPI00249A9487|nr:hypothetical protein [Solwaraspora sp. WMMD791]WFE27642.1 hypothetical protein O7623_31295 [Solwaraspora sp. WMMD791]WFE27655.1 hypothetical protein O7623_00060 [Solwaraspora sp. WMMD791]
MAGGTGRMLGSGSPGRTIVYEAPNSKAPRWAIVCRASSRFACQYAHGGADCVDRAGR